LGWPPFMTWLLYGSGTIFNFSHTKIIFRKNNCAPEPLSAYFSPKMGRWVYDGGADGAGRN
jgi:hypothetical protein